jgi:uncharacterized membrane protein
MTRTHLGMALALILGTLVASGALYPSLPERVPTHWNIRGEVDAYGSKSWSVLIMPIGMAVLLGVFVLLPWLSPARFRIEPFRATYGYIAVAVLALMAYIHGLTLLAALSPKLDFLRAMLSGMFLFFALIGNVLGKVRRNFWMGVRVPWTLASERVWNDTHRFAAWIFVACGLAGFVLSLAGFVLTATATLAIAVVAPILYSFLLYKRLERAGQLGDEA